MTANKDFAAQAREAQITLGTIHKITFQAMVRHLTAHGEGVSPLQFGMLRMLSSKHMTLSELSRKFQLDPSTLVPSVKGLEDRGLLVRRRDPKDRRRQPLELTDEGKALMNMVPMQVEDDPLVAAMQAMGAEKAGQLLLLLREIVSHIADEASLCELHERLAIQDRPSQA